jgi:CubicO group peptidase (beta-lactamase class C family)
MKPWANEDTPGCAVAVTRDGELVHAKGYGMTDLEHAMPITTETVFDIGSTSKQFTAAAVLLAVAEGKLGLDDDIRLHVPGLPKLGETPTTIAHLLHHTGGLRDFGLLIMLGGRRVEDVVTVKETLERLALQRGRNFEPGGEMEYSNTGYFLLAQAVEHATGQSLDSYLRAKVFEPLGMTRSQVQGGHERAIEGRAIGYTPQAEGWRVRMSGWEQTGPGAVMSTVLDLAKWDANFYAPEVGGKALIEQLQTRGTLADKTQLDYAAGLIHGEYRGQATVWHSGGFAGYTAQFERFVELNTSIIVLCNSASARPDVLAHGIADVVLEEELLAETKAGDPVVAQAAQAAVVLNPADLDAWTATYRERSTGRLISMEASEGALVLVVEGERTTLVPTSKRAARLGAGPDHLELNGAAPQRTIVAKKEVSFMVETYDEIVLVPPSLEELETLAGRFHSEEIGTAWTLSISDGRLMVTGAVFEEPAELERVEGDDYSITQIGATARFARDRRGRVTGFAFGLDRMRGIEFERVQ